MKKAKITLLLPLLLLPACSAWENPREESLCLSLSLDIPTKSITDEGEDDITRWTAFAFNTEDPSEFYRESAGGGSPIAIPVKRGYSYRIYAVANSPEYGHGSILSEEIENEEEFKAFHAHLSSCSPAFLPMGGVTETGQVERDMSATIPLSRAVGKVVVDKISLNMDDIRYRSADFTLMAVYLTNVYCIGTYCSESSSDAPSADPDFWYNAMGLHGSGENALMDALTSRRGINAAIAHGDSFAQRHTFYCMPNPIALQDDTRSGTWTPRCTRLVIQAEIGNKTYYYPVTLPSLERNHAYVIEEAIIRSPGSLSPEEEIPGAVEVRLSVQGEEQWDDTFHISENS